MTALFELGTVVTTPGALDTFDRGTLLTCLRCHVTGEWGDLCEEDKRLNNAALDNGNRIMSSYKLSAGTLWIITEADRSVTTFLLPEEY